MNVQYAIHDGKVYVLEVNPRASRTVPFVSKATGVPLAKIAARLMVGRKLQEFDLPAELKVSQYCVKSPVFPFSRFPGVDTILGPEMKSTGEVMGDGRFLRKGLRQGADQRGLGTAEVRGRVHQRQPARQEVHREDCRRSCGDGLQA